MSLSRERLTTLSRECNAFGETAALAYLDGEVGTAAAAADRAVDAAGALHRNEPADHEVAGVYAERLRDRAEIRLVLASGTAGRAGRARALATGGVEDATRAIALIRELDGVPQDRSPLRIADILLLRGELHATIGKSDFAVRDASLSIEEHRRRHHLGDQDSDLLLARALCRYADVMDVVGAAQALSARIESVRLYRAHAGPEGDLWSHRFSRGSTWLSTPTLARFCQTAFRVAADLGPPAIGTAAEAMPALQDAAEGHAGLLLQPGLKAALAYADPLTANDFVALMHDLRELTDWSRAISAPWLVRAYQEAGNAVLEAMVDERYFELIRDIRDPLTQTLTRLAGRGRHGRP